MVLIDFLKKALTIVHGLNLFIEKPWTIVHVFDRLIEKSMDYSSWFKIF